MHSASQQNKSDNKQQELENPCSIRQIFQIISISLAEQEYCYAIMINNKKKKISYSIIIQGTGIEKLSENII